jgi:hypothetical protein
MQEEPGLFSLNLLLFDFGTNYSREIGEIGGLPLESSDQLVVIDIRSHDGRHRSRMEDVIEFESRVNDVWSQSDDAVICTYHLARFSGDAVIDIMRTHPMVIIGGILQENPFFTPPAEFLREYRERRSARMPHL